jgi:rhodanese-related sulfurtransferase
MLQRMVVLGLTSLSMLALADTPTAKIAPDQLVDRIEKQDPNLVILDVRTPEEFAAGHVPGARNIPHDQLPNRLAEITGAKEKDVVVYCRSGKRAAVAEETLTSNGFKRLLHLDGDMIKWQEEKRALEK